MEDEDDDNDDDVETAKDVRKIEAHLPYIANLAVPNNRKFCNVTFSHGQGIGTLLHHDDVINDVTDNITSVNMEHTAAAQEQVQEEKLEESVPNFSIDEYCNLCLEHLSFTESDVLLARRLYEAISQAGAMGISMPYLKQVSEAYSKYFIPSLLLIAN